MQRRMTPREQRQWALYTGTVVIVAVVLIIAPPVVQWLTGFQKYDNGRYCSKDPSAPDVDEGKVCLPENMSGIFDKVISGLRALGGVILVVGFIWSGIKLQAVPSRESEPK